MARDGAQHMHGERRRSRAPSSFVCVIAITSTLLRSFIYCILKRNCGANISMIADSTADL